MAADLQSLDENVAAPAGLSIERVADRGDLEQWSQVGSSVFQMPDFAMNSLRDLFSNFGHALDAPYQHFVAHLDGHLNDRPVACATVFLGGGVAGIYSVGTVTEARRLGIGRAITVAALRHARQAGYRYSILHASAAGLNLYRGLGFKEYCPIVTYVWTGKNEVET